MSVGNSGRIVIEIDPQLKKELYSILKSQGLTLKEWFLNQSMALLNKTECEDNEVES